MSELSHDALERFERHGLLAEDAVHLPDIGCRFLWWESYRTLDTVKPEPDHVLGAVEVPIALCQLLG
jgi:hypothetical protein